ncbi:protein suppressor 2 of zeste-like isoform X2 [Daktulosphaira vitifoliae]|nr:protein suppressor 2 of zeste-like isoform X2 [Daktulosphaira vitifoliae]
MKESRQKLQLKDLNPHLLCVLCGGYYIEPSTIVECLHSFCRSCIVKYLETNRFCPICDVQVHKTKPLLSLRRDEILEKLVYKIVPGLYAKEMARRSAPKKELYLSPDDHVSLVLDYQMEDECTQANDNDKVQEQNKTSASEAIKAAHRKYLNCPAAVTVEHLKKFIVIKYYLTDQHEVDIFHSNESLPDELTLIDVAYCFEWKQTSPMELCFKILEKSTIAIPIVEEEETVEDVDIEEDVNSVASSLPFMSSKSVSECDETSNASLDSKPLIERLNECDQKSPITKRKRRAREFYDEGPVSKKSLFDSLFLSAKNNNNIEKFIEDEKDFQESDEDYSKYEQDIEEIIEDDEEDEDTGRLRISSNNSEEEELIETASQMFVIEDVEEEKRQKKDKHSRHEGSRNKKKSKKGKHHHHHKRRSPPESPPPSATIVHSPDRDIMKLKVKLNTLPGYRHKEEKHHRHSKHHNGTASPNSSIVSSPARSSFKEDDSQVSELSSDSIIMLKDPPKKFTDENKVLKTNEVKPKEIQEKKVEKSASGTKTSLHSSNHRSPKTADEPPKTTSIDQKEAVLQLRSSKQKSAVKPQNDQLHQQVIKTKEISSSREMSPKMLIMPPSSITVSIITAEEKMKMEKDKTLMLSGGHDMESKRPSLEIVRVNGPPSSPTAEVPVSKVPNSITHHNSKLENPLQSETKPKTKKPVPAVIPIKSAKPSITIIPQNRSPSGANNNNNTMKQEDLKSSVTISLENGTTQQQSDALDLSGKSTRKDNLPYAIHNGNMSPAHFNGQYDHPGSMRNLLTLSDTAAHIRSMMSPTGQENSLKKRFSQNQNGSSSPKWSASSNGTNLPLRIPVPPMPSFKSQHSSNKNLMAVAKNSVTRINESSKPKHGPPNQGVRHIPNPSVLLFRQHQQQLVQFAAAAAAAVAAGQQRTTMPPQPLSQPSNLSPHPNGMPGAIPLHTIRKMENMTKNIEKVAAGLSVKASALYKQSFMENGRTRVELPS